MLVKITSVKRTDGGRRVWLVVEYKLFGLVTIFATKTEIS